jgi:beta-lactamase superfamily II metal-dependent hydrolase
MSVHSVDAIAKPEVVKGLAGRYSQTRVVHFSKSGPCGPSHLLVKEDLVDRAANPEDRDSLRVAHGRSFELIRSGVDKAASKLSLGGRKRSIPVISQDNLEKCLKRRTDVEDELAQDIGAAMKRATPPELGSGRHREDHTRPPGPTRISVFDVGQGDSIGVSFADGTLWLVDAYSWSVERSQSLKTSLRNWSGRTTVDCLIRSHLHCDHIRLAECVVRRLHPTEVVLAADFIHKTAAVRNLVTLCDRRGILRTVGGSSSAQFGATTARLIAASSLPAAVHPDSDPNDHGLFAIIEGQRSTAVLPGDASRSYLDCLVTDGHVQGTRDTRFYKVTHHCSDTGRCPGFIAGFRPTAAATSCSRGNRYEFPHCRTRHLIEGITGLFQQGRGHGITWRDRSQGRCLSYELA